MKNVLISVSVLALITILILTGCLIGANKRIGRVKAGCLREIHSSLRELESYLPQWSENPADARLNDYIQRSLMSLVISVRAAESLYDEPIHIMSNGVEGFGFIADCLSDFSTQINGRSYCGIMYDGRISDTEREYIDRLIADLSALHEPLLAEDGLNLRPDAKYDDIRKGLSEFTGLWGYNYAPDAPISLLSGD